MFGLTSVEFNVFFFKSKRKIHLTVNFVDRSKCIHVNMYSFCRLLFSLQHVSNLIC